MRGRRVARRQSRGGDAGAAAGGGSGIGGGEVTREVSRGGDVGIRSCGGGVGLLKLIGGEEEELVAAVEKPGYAHGAAEGEAVLVLMQRVLGGAGGFRSDRGAGGEEVGGVDEVVADELKGRSVKDVGAGLVTTFIRPPAWLPSCPPSAADSTLNWLTASGKGKGRLELPM